MPLISVIVPIYNAERYLSKCLDSILSQTMNDYEVLLIDDGSTDTSGIICDEYTKKDDRFITIHKKNEGPSIARNEGISRARGKWITFLDSDDFLENHFFEILNVHNDVDYIITSYCKHKGQGESVEEKYDVCKNYSIGSELFVENNLKIGFFTPWAKFFRTQIIKCNKLNFVPNISPGEDTLFILQYLNLIESYLISNIVCYNWLEANGMTNRNREIDCIINTIDLTLNALYKIENKLDFDIPLIKYNSLLYLLSRIDIENISYCSLYKKLQQISKRKWLMDLVHEKSYVRKGKQRKLVDFLISNHLYLILTIWCKFTNRFYI